MPRVAILIDGGYFLKRLPSVRRDIDTSDPGAVAQALNLLIRRHLDQVNTVYKVENSLRLLYRSFYYDALPYTGKVHTPVGKRAVDYSKTPEAIFRKKLFDSLRGQPNLAVRLGEVRKNHDSSWVLKARPQKRLLNGDIPVSALTDNDFAPALRQKGVDMRIGIDIVSITLKRQAKIIILVSGDADFVPAARFARREGVQFILDPLWQDISTDLFEHIDGLRSGFPRPGSNQQDRPDLSNQRDQH